MVKTFSTTHYFTEVKEEREIFICRYKIEGYICDFAWVSCPPLFNVIVNLDNLNDLKGSGCIQYKDLVISVLNEFKLTTKQKSLVGGHLN